MKGMLAVYRRELAAYLATPAGYIFIAVFLIAAGGLTFQAAGFFESDQADLTPFFVLHPWLLLGLTPALAMKLWADENRQGTIETLLTLPVSMPAIVLGKHLAAWTVAGFALILTMPIWATVNYLGAPDNAAIAAAYFMSFLAAGAFLALGQAASAITGQQSAAFVLALALGFLFTAAGAPAVTDAVARAFGPTAADLTAPFGVAARLEPSWRGVFDFGAAFYFVLFTSVWLAIAGLFASTRRGG